MNNNQLQKYINDSLSAGLSRQVIEQNLLSAGWQKEVIDSGFPQVANQSRINIPHNLPSIILRIGLAFVFLYAAFFVSGNETGGKYVPHFVSTIVPINTFLLVFGVFEGILAIWILTGKFRLYSGLLAACLLTGITLFNLSLISMLFRNVAIIAAALAFALL